MAQWAYAARSCTDGHLWWVARDEVDAMPPQVGVVRVKVGPDWCCARVDRSRAVDVEAPLLRQVVASDLDDCADCAPPPGAETGRTATDTPAPSGPGIEAAAITRAGRRMLVVLVPLDVVQSPGEAEMLAEDLRPRFGSVDVVLVAQDDDGMPHYHGDDELQALLAGVPLERMPWRTYPPA